MTTPMCFFCWPRATQAKHTDATGLPCCAACANNPDRKCQVPSFIVKRLRDEWSVAEAAEERKRAA